MFQLVKGLVKEKILELLKKKTYVSGEELSRKFNLSRTAVWKHIKALRRKGYVVEAKPRQGYRLVKTPDLLLPVEIKAELKTKIFGKKIFHFNEVTSTQEVAKKLATQGFEEGTVVVAEKQSKGKGRVGREWVSPLGGVWLSIILKPNILPHQAQKITLVVAVAVANVIRRLYGLDAKIKWPNDVLIDKKKVCGILVEASGEVDRLNYMVVGVGVNLNVNPATVESKLVKTATSISEILGREVSKVEFTREFLVEFEKLYKLFGSGGFNQILEEWKKLSETLGCKVKIVSQNEVFVGEALDVDEEGFLLVKLPNGFVKKVVSGDVYVRKV